MGIDRFKDYDLNLLVVLHVLLEERSVSGAARRLGVAQSAASRSLARLREQLDDEVLVRTGRRMTPTPRAEAMKEPLRELLLGAGKLLFETREVEPATLTRTFRIGSSDYPTGLLLPRLVAHLEHAAPHVRIDLRPFRRTFDEELVGAELDLVVAPKRDATAGIVWSRLLRDRLVTVARQGHPRVEGPLTLARFMAERHVVAGPEGGPETAEVARLLDVEGSSRAVVRVASFHAAVQLVRASDMLTTLPRGVLSSFSSDTLQVFEPPVAVGPIALHAGWHERLRHDAPHAWLRGVLATVALGLEDT